MTLEGGAGGAAGSTSVAELGLGAAGNVTFISFETDIEAYGGAGGGGYHGGLAGTVPPIGDSNAVPVIEGSGGGGGGSSFVNGESEDPDEVLGTHTPRTSVRWRCGHSS